MKFLCLSISVLFHVCRVSLNYSHFVGLLHGTCQHPPPRPMSTSNSQACTIIWIFWCELEELLECPSLAYWLIRCHFLHFTLFFFLVIQSAYKLGPSDWSLDYSFGGLLSFRVTDLPKGISCYCPVCSWNSVELDSLEASCYTHTNTHMHLLSDYSLSTPLEQSRGANCVATANMLRGCRPKPNGPSTCPRCQQGPLALSARLLPER